MPLVLFAVPNVISHSYSYTLLMIRRSSYKQISLY